MGMLDKAKNAAKTTKLKGEIVLLDREIKAKKQKFGIEVSDLLWDMDAKQKALGGRESTFLKSLRKEWDVAKADLTKTREKKDEIQAKIEADSQKSTEDASVMDKAKAAGTDGKRRTKLQLLDRELKARKQKFGMDAYDAAVEIVRNTSAKGGTLTDTKNQGAQSMTNAIDKNNKMSFVEKQLAKTVIGKVSAGLTQLTVSDQDVLKCIQTVQSDVGAIQLKKDFKRSEIEKLKQ